jgi:hypothetical protein
MQLSIGIVEGLILPTSRAIENDLYPGAGSPRKSRIYEQMRELVKEITVEIPSESEQTPVKKARTIEVRTARDSDYAFIGEGDEIVGNVIARLLVVEGNSMQLILGEHFAPRKSNVY